MNIHLQAKLDDVKRITEGCRDDMHEPDVTASVLNVHTVKLREVGRAFPRIFTTEAQGYLDNAMGEDIGPTDELVIELKRGDDIVLVNLATLIALARMAS